MVNTKPNHKALKDALPQQGDFNAENILTQLGKNISIKGVEMVKSQTGKDCGIIITESGERYYTFSKVIIDQLKNLVEVLKTEIVDATLEKRKNYYILV